LAVLLLGGLIAVLVFIFRDQLTPAKPVGTGRVILLAGDTDSASSPVAGDELLFQASGWIEPDPWHVDAFTLVDGFVLDVYVKEGQVVTNGQIVARLDPGDAELGLRVAAAAVRAARARVETARDTWSRIEPLPARDTTPAERVAAENAVVELDAELAVAEAKRDMAQLALDRTVVRAPIDGIVQRLYAHPGLKRRAGSDDPESTTIVSLFDPARLQVRVDVPLAEAGRLFVGQPTRISTAMLPGAVFTGRVTRIVGEADLQRNTLQAKVEVHDPDPRMRPEVLCRVEFRGSSGSQGNAQTSANTGRQTLWIPEEALGDPSRSEQDVWVIDPISDRAERRAVRLGPSRRDGYRRVLDGLRPNETVVTSGAAQLEAGDRVIARNKEDSP
jgi:RND family efflux transporter MFP subunit